MNLLTLLYSLQYLAYCAVIITVIWMVRESWVQYVSIKSGVPYVPTSLRGIKKVFKSLQMRSGASFLELGSGDGRVSRYVAKKYDLQAYGVDLNPLLVSTANRLSWLSRLNARFEVRSFLDVDMSQADYIYLFLTQRAIALLRQKLTHEPKKGCVIIAHVFPVDFLQEYLAETLTFHGRKSFVYRIK